MKQYKVSKGLAKGVTALVAVGVAVLAGIESVGEDGTVSLSWPCIVGVLIPAVRVGVNYYKNRTQGAMFPGLKGWLIALLVSSLFLAGGCQTPWGLFKPDIPSMIETHAQLLLAAQAGLEVWQSAWDLRAEMGDAQYYRELERRRARVEELVAQIEYLRQLLYETKTE